MPTPIDVAPVIEKVLEESPVLPLPAVEKVVEVTSTVPVESVVEVTTTVPDVGDILGGFPLDLPLPLIGGTVIAAIAAVVILGVGKGETSIEENALSVVEQTSSTVKTVPSGNSSYDVSVPYDAAAMLAYDEAGKPGDFNSFKTKYLADTVAMIKAKQKK